MESIELLLQIIVEESTSAFASGLEEDAAAWVRDYVYTPTHTNRKALINMLLYNRCRVLFSSCYKVLTLFLSGGAVPTECPRVQQAAGSLEQVRSYRTHMYSMYVLNIWMKKYSISCMINKKITHPFLKLQLIFPNLGNMNLHMFLLF